MSETLMVLFVLLLSPLCVMLIGGDNVTLSSSVPSSIPSPSTSSISTSSISMSAPASAVSSSSSTSNAPSSQSPLALALATVAEPALLAHMYDTNVNFRHRHHPNHPWGPHFEENVINVTVREFQNIHLDCRVGLIEDKLVSWARRKSDELELLTLGLNNHSSDPRFYSNFKYPNNWRLGIRNVSRNDTGTYMCQIQTYPVKSIEVQLNVEAPEVFVISSRGERVQDVYYKEGSTLQLICEVNNVKSRLVNWYHNSELLNHDITRGGVSIKTEITANRAKSILQLARITRKDIGTYLCSSPPQNASTNVHILNGENPAELYHNEGSRMLVLSQHLGCFHHYPHNHQFYQPLVLAIFSILFTSMSFSTLFPASDSRGVYYSIPGFLYGYGRELVTHCVLLIMTVIMRCSSTNKYHVGREATIPETSSAVKTQLKVQGQIQMLASVTTRRKIICEYLAGGRSKSFT